MQKKLDLTNLKAIIREFCDYANRKEVAKNAMEKRLIRDKEELKPEFHKKLSDKLNSEHYALFHSEYSALSEKLNQELDKLKSVVEKGIADSKPDNFDSKLLSSLKMLEVLSGEDLTENEQSVRDTVKIFSHDILAKKSIEKILANKKLVIAGLFDNEAEKNLEKLEKFRKYTDVNRCNDTNTAFNLLTCYKLNFGDDNDDFSDMQLPPLSINPMIIG